MQQVGFGKQQKIGRNHHLLCQQPHLPRSHFECIDGKLGRNRKECFAKPRLIDLDAGARAPRTARRQRAPVARDDGRRIRQALAGDDVGHLALRLQRRAGVMERNERRGAEAEDGQEQTGL